MPLPRSLVYNDLNGEEVKHILGERFGQLLNEVPYLQKHITLPRVKMTLTIDLDCWADQATPERKSINDQVDVISENNYNPSANAGRSYAITASIDASPKGDPPDMIREQYGVGIPTPVKGLIATEDRVEGRRMKMATGAMVDRTGNNTHAKNATVIEQDFGRASEGRPEVQRDKRGQVTPPNFKEFGK
jgi:hypothetical protein